MKGIAALVLTGTLAVGGAACATSNIGDMLKRDPFAEARAGGEHSQLLKQIHDDPYQKSRIQGALKIGVLPEDIYNAIGWGITQLQDMNDKRHEQILQSGRHKMPDGSLTAEFQDILLQDAHYFRVLGELRRNYGNGDAMGALTYWLEKIAN